MLVYLLPELLGEICDYLPSLSLLELACCNSDYYSVTREYLLQTVKLSKPRLLGKDITNERYLDDLKHAKTLLVHAHTLSSNQDERGVIVKRFKLVLAHCEPVVLHAVLTIDDVLEDIIKLKSLRELHLFRTRTDNTHMEAFCTNLEGLRVLNVRATKVTDLGLNRIYKLAKLQDLDCGRCAITDQSIEHASHLTTLERLNFSDCRNVSCVLPLASLQSLRYLDLSLTGVSNIEALGALRNLSYLNLSFCANLSGAGFATFTNKVYLRELKLNGCPITDEDTYTIGALKSLNYLQLRNTNILGPGVGELCGLENLTELDLSDCGGISDSSLEHIPKLRRLRKLNLLNTIVTDEKALTLSDQLKIETKANGGHFLST